MTLWKAYPCKNRGTGLVSVGYNVDSSSSRNFNARYTVPKGEVITVSSITLDEVTTANISIPSGSTEYNVLVVGHKDDNSINIVNETIKLTN
ncbi:MAG: hypothetical protein IJP63_01265 [Acholeplasmatales bacterium]|nr:hypothetical protein [Acholeplasmatales bacterium]